MGEMLEKRGNGGSANRKLEKGGGRKRCTRPDRARIGKRRGAIGGSHLFPSCDSTAFFKQNYGRKGKSCARLRNGDKCKKLSWSLSGSAGPKGRGGLKDFINESFPRFNWTGTMEGGGPTQGKKR